MARNRTYRKISFGVISGNALILFGIIGFVTFIFFSTKNRIHDIHREIFNNTAPLTYDVDFENLRVIARTRITSHPRAETTQWKELPFISQSQTFRVTHKIGFGSHRGVIELKVGDNGQEAEFLSSDIVMDFEVGFNDLTFNIAPFQYDTPEFRLSFGDLSGSFSRSGDVKLSSRALELRMVNYVFKLTDLQVSIPPDKKSITLLASNIALDEVNFSHSKVVLGGTNPFEINLDSSFNAQPVEVRWNILKTTVLNQDVQVGSGKMKFPVALLDAYIEPKIKVSQINDKEKALDSKDEKVRFLYSAANEVRRAEAKAVALRVITPAKNVERDGDSYVIRIEKEDAFKHVEEATRSQTERKAFISSWSALPSPKMFEEVFYGIVFGNDNRALAAKEFLQEKKTELGDDALYLAIKARSAMRDALIYVDEYNPDLLNKAAALIPAVENRLPDHKFTVLLKLEVAKARADKELANQLYETFKTKEQEPQILAMFEFMKYLHVDNPKALESLELAHSMNPKSLYVQNHLRNRIHIYQHMDDKSKIEEDFNTLLGSQNLIPEDLSAYSKLLEEKKDLDNALNVVEKCLEINSIHKKCNEQRESVMTLIAYEKQKSNPEEAIQYLQNVLVDRPASIPVNAGLGLLFKSKGDQANSIKHYSIACALGGSLGCIEAADLLSRQGISEKATLLYDVSCDLRSGNGCMKAGLHAEKSGDLARSEVYYDKACNEFHDNVSCYHLARSLQKKRAPNRSIAPYLSKACKHYDSACKLASVYQNSNKQPEIPLEPK